MPSRPFGLVVLDYSKFGKFRNMSEKLGDMRINPRYFNSDEIFYDPSIEPEKRPDFGHKVWSHLISTNPAGKHEIPNRELFAYIPAQVTPAADSTINVDIQKTVSGKEVAIIHPWYVRPASEHTRIAELTIDALYSANARRIILLEPFNPFYSYDAHHGRDALGAKVTIKNYESRSPKVPFTIVTFVPHSKQLDLAGDDPFIPLPLLNFFCKHIGEKYDLRNAVFSGTDAGSMKVSEKYGEVLDRPAIKGYKRKTGVDSVKSTELDGMVEGSNVWFFDDMIRTMGTVLSAADAARQNGAKEICVSAPHMSLDFNFEKGKWAEDLVSEYDIRVVGSNTIPRTIRPENKHHFNILDVTPTASAVIGRLLRHESISGYFASDYKEYIRSLGR